VVIPVKNGGPRLAKVLDSILAQNPPGKPERIVAVDSGSTDGSLEILKEKGVEIITIPSSEFRHGDTRNLGSSGTSSEVIIFNNQDAIPADSNCYRQLMEDLFSDPSCAGVCALLIPHTGCDPLAKRDVLGESGIMTGWRYTGIPDEKKRSRMKHFHTICCAVRTDLFREIPFRSVVFGEDYLWNRDVNQAGYHTGISGAVARHSHNTFPHPFRFLKIHADSSYFREKYEPICLFKRIRWLVGGIFLDWIFIGRQKALGIDRKAGWMAASPLIRTMQFTGGLLGRYHDHLPSWLLKRVFFYYPEKGQSD